MNIPYHGKEKLATLQRRADYLRDVIATQGGVSWDKAELSALEWAIEELTKGLTGGGKAEHGTS